MALRFEWRLLNDFHHRFLVARVMFNEFVIHGGGDELEVVRELGDPREMDSREDPTGGGSHDVGEPESRGDGVDSKGLGNVGLCEGVI